jgi:hypothetical protein
MITGEDIANTLFLVFALTIFGLGGYAWFIIIRDIIKDIFKGE